MLLIQHRHFENTFITFQGHNFSKAIFRTVVHKSQLLSQLLWYRPAECKKGRISSYYVTIPVSTVFVNSALICNIQVSSRIVKFSLFLKLLYLFALLFRYLFGE